MFAAAKTSILLGLGIALLGWGQSRVPSGGSFRDRTFEFYHEFYGPQAFLNPEASANFRNRMANGVSLQPPLNSGLVDFVSSRGLNLMVDLRIQSRADLTPFVFNLRQKDVEDLAGTGVIAKVLWNVMPEWDQSGGNWVPDGRPRYRGFTKAQAYGRFLEYYYSAYPSLFSFLEQPVAARKYWMTAVTDHPSNTFYSYEMGADVCLLERGIDELGDISTGIPFIRGAGQQYDRQWGIDVATYRTSNGMATRFDSRENLLGGWSPSYLRRHYYIAYMAGAHVLRNQATGYYGSGQDLDPFGRMNKDFADFALNRHTDVGRPVVTTALLLDHYSGFDTKHWYFNQADAVWYQDIPYTDGDRMINSFLRLAYPNHWLHGQTPGAPFNDSTGKPDAKGFQAYLARGGDPRPYEPMSLTRYGHSLDVVTNRVSLEALRQYKVILMLGDVPIESRLRSALTTWVQEGGTLVLTAPQTAAFDEKFLGARVENTRRTGTSSRWLLDGSSYREAPFWFSPLTVTTATVFATAEGSQPLLTANAVGKGQVILSAGHYLQGAVGDQFLTIGTLLFDWLGEQNPVARVTGAPVEYIVNEAPGRVIVTVVNNSGSDWAGTVVVPVVGEVRTVREYIADQDAPWSRLRSRVTVTGQVPAYDVKVYAVEFGPTDR